MISEEVELTITKVPPCLALDAEASGLLERLNNPQDLNDALIAVSVQHFAKIFAERMQRQYDLDAFFLLTQCHAGAG